jgi:hypothetical protein
VRGFVTDPPTRPAAKIGEQSFFIYTERNVDISSWKPNEWHHILHAWNTYIDQHFYVDGIKNYASSYDRQSGESEKPWVLATETLEPKILAGGSEVYLTSPYYIYRTKEYQPGLYKRFINGVIDDVDIYAIWLMGGVSFFRPPERYLINKTYQPYYEGAFDLKVNYPVKLAWAAWTVYLPDPSLDVEITLLGDQKTLSSSSSSIQLKHKKINTGKVLYRFSFVNTRNLFPVTKTPTVDDIAIAYYRKFSFLALTFMN